MPTQCMCGGRGGAVGAGAQEQRLSTLATGRPLGTGDYRDASRPLRRLLKQFGDGSLEAGLRHVAVSPAAQNEVIALLSVDKQVRPLVFPGMAWGRGRGRGGAPQ